MIGSQRKVISVFKHLRDNGIDGSLLKRVHAPIGLDIGALMHEEIAVSVVAELISVRRNAQNNVEHLKSRKAIEIPSRVSQVHIGYDLVTMKPACQNSPHQNVSVHPPALPPVECL